MNINENYKLKTNLKMKEILERGSSTIRRLRPLLYGLVVDLYEDESKVIYAKDT